jgi:hypothetical protein
MAWPLNSGAAGGDSAPPVAAWTAPQREPQQLRVALARPYGHEGDPVVLARAAHACSSDVFLLPTAAEMIIAASRPRDPAVRAVNGAKLPSCGVPAWRITAIR